MVSRLADALLSVFDRGFGTAADAGHAVGTVVSPHWPPAFQADVVHGTERSASPAPDAAVRGPECVRFHEQRIEGRINDVALYPVQESTTWIREDPTLTDQMSRVVYWSGIIFIQSRNSPSVKGTVLLTLYSSFLNDPSIDSRQPFQLPHRHPLALQFL